MKDVTGRVAIVTAGGSGIGRGVALALAGAGARVVVADVVGERASAVAAEVEAAGSQGLGVACDVAADGSFEALRDATLDRFGQIDIVHNNVGVIASGLPEAIPVEAWRRIVEVNLMSVVRSNLVFVPLLLERGDGHLLFTASTNPLFPYSYDRLPYTATKGAVVALVESLALYLKPRGVGVSLLCPGPVATNIGEQIRSYGEPQPVRGPGFAVLRPEEVGQRVLDGIRADRFLILTHPEVRDLMVQRAQDTDAFLDAQIKGLQS